MRSTSTLPSDAEYGLTGEDTGQSYVGIGKSRLQRKLRRRGARPSVDTQTSQQGGDAAADDINSAYWRQSPQSDENDQAGPRPARRARRKERITSREETDDAHNLIRRFLGNRKGDTRRGARWREHLYAKHSVTETGFPAFAGMKPVVGFLMIPALIVLGITLTGGHWPKAVLYPLAIMMGLYVLMSAFRGVELVLAVLLLYVPFSPVYVIPLAPGVNGTNALIALGLMATLVQSRTHRFSWFNWRRGTTLVFMYAVVTTMSGLTIMFQPDGYYYLMGGEFQNYKQWIEQFVVYFIALSCIRDHAAAKRVYFYMCIGSVLVVIYAVPEMVSKQGLSTIEKSRISGPLAQSNEFGGFLAYTLMLTGGLFLAYFREVKAWIFSPFFLLALKVLISTFSRGAYLALMGGGLIAGYLRGKVFLASWAFAALLFFAIFPQFLPDAIVDRLSASFQESESTAGPAQLDKSSEHRLILWKAAADMTLESPITGKGFKGFQKMKHLYTERPVHEKDPHSYYLYVSSQMGLPALFIFFCILIYAFYSGVVLSRDKKDTFVRAIGIAGASAAATYGAVCLFGSRATNPEFTAYFWVMLACMQVLRSPDNPQSLAEKQLRNENRRSRLPMAGEDLKAESEGQDLVAVPSERDQRGASGLNSNDAASAPALSRRKKKSKAPGRAKKVRRNAFDVAREQENTRLGRST